MVLVVSAGAGQRIARPALRAGPASSSAQAMTLSAGNAAHRSDGDAMDVSKREVKERLAAARKAFPLASERIILKQMQEEQKRRREGCAGMEVARATKIGAVTEPSMECTGEENADNAENAENVNRQQLQLEGRAGAGATKSERAHGARAHEVNNGGVRMNIRVVKNGCVTIPAPPARSLRFLLH